MEKLFKAMKARRSSDTICVSDTAYQTVRTSEDGSDPFPNDQLEKQQFRFNTLNGPHRQSRLRLVTLQIILLAVYSLGSYIYVTRELTKNPMGSLVHSPANEAVIWEEHRFVLGDKIQEKSEYSGRPSAALDKAWHDLLNDENIRLEPEYVKRLQRDDVTVRMPGDDGYIGTLNVYHELHCLKRIHQGMYPEYYWSDLSPEDVEMNRMHNEHCIDFLRQSAMCHGDVGLITYYWSPVSRIPVANATTHQCVNWNSLHEWTKQRSVDMMAPGWLIHPQLGLAYPDGKGDVVGVADPKHADH